jgi:hypothetical protein
MPHAGETFMAMTAGNLIGGNKNSIAKAALIARPGSVGNNSQKSEIPHGTTRRKLQNTIGEKHGRKD